MEKIKIFFEERWYYGGWEDMKYYADVDLYLPLVKPGEKRLHYLIRDDEYAPINSYKPYPLKPNWGVEEPKSCPGYTWGGQTFSDYNLERLIKFVKEYEENVATKIKEIIKKNMRNRKKLPKDKKVEYIFDLEEIEKELEEVEYVCDLEKIEKEIEEV